MESAQHGPTAQKRAIERFVEIGLTEYEARSFVALSRLSQGTAKEVSELSDVPNSRVYDTLDGLHDIGLVEVEQGNPRRYQAVPVDVAISMFRREHDRRLDSLSETLAALDPVDREDGAGVWTLSSHEHVLARERTLLEQADDEIVFSVVDDSVLTDETIDRLAAADEDGASVVVEAVSEEVRERLSAELPEVDVEAPTHEWTVDDAAVGRILLVDREAALVSTSEGERLPGVPQESAVWSRDAGPGAGLVSTMRRLVSPQPVT